MRGTRLTMPVKFSVAGTERKGSRNIQADRHIFRSDTAAGRLVVVIADGVGDDEYASATAQAASHRAAEMAIACGDPAAAIRDARANHHLRDPNLLDDACLTVVVAHTNSPEVQVAWVGDCRVYHRSITSDVTLATHDHTEGAYYRANGIIPPSNPIVPLDSILTASLARGEIDTVTITVGNGSRLLICTDGVSRQVTHASIGRALSLLKPPADVAERLAEQAATNTRRSDNVAAVVIDVNR